VRDALRANPAIGVAAAAEEYGFSHFGHFSALYPNALANTPPIQSSGHRKSYQELHTLCSNASPSRYCPSAATGGDSAELALAGGITDGLRSEEHPSELQSLAYL